MELNTIVSEVGTLVDIRDVSVSFLLPHPVKRLAVIVHARTSTSVFFFIFFSSL